MIFLTVGSELPFDRLVRAVDQWCAERGRDDVFGQIASLSADNYRPTHFEYCDFLSPADYDRYCREAPVIVGHAGMGSIITAMTYLKPIVLMPRRVAFKETRNDHQVATAEKLGTRDGILVAENENCLSDALDQALAGLHEYTTTDHVPLGPHAEPRLLAAIREFILKD